MSAGHRDSGTQAPLTDRDRIGWASGTRVSSGGSAGSLPMTNEEKAAVKPRSFFGFARPEEMERLVERALTDAGEAAWTARDTFVIASYPDGHVEVR